MPVSLEQVKWIKAIILIIVVENPCIKSFFFHSQCFSFLSYCLCSLDSQILVCQSRLINASQFNLPMKVCSSLSDVK